MSSFGVELRSRESELTLFYESLTAHLHQGDILLPMSGSQWLDSNHGTVPGVLCQPKPTRSCKGPRRGGSWIAALAGIVLECRQPSITAQTCNVFRQL